MGVTVKFWSFSKKKNSTKVPTALPSYTFDCQIKAETTLTDPVIELNTGSATSCTYAQIGDFGRYYFIREWTFDRGLWTAYLEVDVLATYKTQIGTQNLYVTRSASHYDGNITDTKYITTNVISESHAQLQAAMNFTDGWIVLGVAGNNSGTGSVVYYETPASGGDLSHIIDTLFSAAYADFASSGYSDGVINSLMNPLQYIISCRWYPYMFPHDNASESEIYCGRWKADGLSSTYQLTGEIPTTIGGSVTVPKHPKAATRGSYLNLPPYSKYVIDFGSVYDIDATKFANESQIFCKLYPDYTTTEALLKVWAGNAETNTPLLSVYVQGGYDIPLSQAVINAGGGISSIIGGSAGAIVSALTGNIPGVIAGVAAGCSGISDATIPTISSTKAGGGWVTYALNRELKAVFYDVVDDDLADFGRPLMKVKQINTLSGFVQCENDDISISCLDGERDRIRSFLTGGFFYE